MKVKKNIIIISFLVIFISLISIYLVKNTDVTYKRVTSDVKEYSIGIVNTSDFVKREDLKCDAYNSVYATQNIILNDKNGNNWYVIQGCAWDFISVLNSDTHGITNDFKKEVCSARREMISNKYPSYEDYIIKFNDSKCVTEFGYEKLEIQEELVECNYFGIKYAGDYDINKFLYGKSEPHACEQDDNSLKGQTGVLTSTATSQNAPSYLVQGCAWDLYDLSINSLGNSCVTKELQKNACKTQKEFVENNHSDNEFYVNNFNTSCIDTGVLEESERLTTTNYIDVIFRANDSYGLECREENTTTYRAFTSDDNECTYRFKKNSSGNTNIFITHLPDTSEVKRVLTGGNFTGWKRTNGSCTLNIGTIAASSDISEIVFNACYESPTLNDGSTYVLYQDCDGNYEIESGANEKTNVSNTALLKSHINTKKTYMVTNEEGIRLKQNNISNGNSFDINNYCSITCTESFEYSYPSLIGTAKSGTYFDLLNYPEVKSSLTCVEDYDYNYWENEYKDSIKEEKLAYVKYKNSSIIDDFTSLSASSTGTSCGCKKTCSSATGSWCCESYYYYTITADFYSLNQFGNDGYGEITNSSASYKYCESDTSRTAAIDDARSQWGISASTDSYKSNWDTKKSERENMQDANKACRNALTVEKNSKDQFYKIDNESSINFYYESDDKSLTPGDDLGLGDKFVQEKLEATNKYSSDTENNNISSSTKNHSTSYPGKSINFDAYNATTFSRTVTRNYVFDKSANHKQYYSKYQTGEIINQDNSDKDKAIYLGYVYPIRLDLSGSRNVYFSINVKTNLNYGAGEILTGANSSENLGVYKCDYEISNDIIEEDKTTSKVDDYKKNFYIRSISTSDVDPNDRYNTGLLGANWANDKGKALIEIIESKSKGNNTYNPDNLEYSFTLNAQTIDAIREYNLQQSQFGGLGYSDFNLECNDMGGECKSKFLNNLAGINPSGQNKVGSINVNNVNAVMQRKTWKYYINGSWLMTNSLTSNSSSNWHNIDATNNSITANISDFDQCIKTSSKNTYDCIYRHVNEGVLP